MSMEKAQNDAELSLISYIVASPKRHILLKENIFSNETYSNIYRIIKENDLVDPLDRMTIYAYSMESDTYAYGADVDEIFQMISEKVITESYAKQCIFNLNKAYETRQVINQILKGLELVKTGKMKDGVGMLKSIKFRSSKKLTQTIDIMKNSILQTSCFRTGISQIDDIDGGLMLGNIMTIGGDSGTMKTMVSIWMCLMILMENPTYTCMYFEKEMHERELGRRLIQLLLNVSHEQILKGTILPYTELSGVFSDPNIDAMALKRKIDETMANAEKYAKEIDLHSNTKLGDAIKRLTIVPSNSFQDAHDMYELIETYKPNIWCLDFVTLLGGSKGKGGDYFMYIVNQMEIIKNMTLDTNTFGICLSQLSMHKAASRQNMIPKTDDFEWGSKLKHFSSWIYTTFYPSLYYGDMLKLSDISMDNSYFYLSNLKSRSGKLKDLCLKASPQYCLFEEVTGVKQVDMLKWLKEYKEIMKGKK